MEGSAVIYEGSRYETADLDRVAGPDGVYRDVLFRRMPPVPADTFLVLVPADTRLDLLAQRYLLDPELWWRIADANPELLYPGEIPAGTVLRIPVATIR